ncbi:MAG: MarR family transcriptional regulator [Candidatus Bathyarchaeia archaeon]|jgi:DNA-binding MarR family transcriptional regulator
MAIEEDLPSGVLFGREFSTSVVLFQEAVASKLGLNATDYRCLELIIRKGSMTAKVLAEEVNLSTGAITGIIDHLEKAGYVERQANPKDRRSIIINPLITHKEIHEKIGNTMESYRTAMTELFKKYDAKQTAAIVDFLQEFVQILKDQTSKLKEK